jgi:NADPH2:quinone reductase
VITLDQGAFHTSVQRVTEGVGLDLVFDHLGGPGITEALHALAPLGTLVSYNIVQGMPTEDVFQTLRALLAKSLAVRCFSMHTFDESRNTRRALMQEAIGLVAQGLVTCPPVQVFRLQDAVHTHVLLDQGQVTGKLVLQP